MGIGLPATSGDALRAVSLNSGWLGSLDTREIAPFASHAGDPLVASWLPTEVTAQGWQALVTP